MEEKSEVSDETEVLNPLNLINMDSSRVISRDKTEPKRLVSNKEYFIFILQTLSENFL